MKLPIYQIDAFNSEVFRGNPAAVCPLRDWLPDNILQSIAAENNLSETAFYIPSKQEMEFEIRWFTPVSEVDLCGHATLATAYVIFNEFKYSRDTIVFNSHSGKLSASKNDCGAITLYFPTYAVKPCDITEPHIEALGAEPIELYEHRNLVAVFASESDVADLPPNISLLKKIHSEGVIVTAPGDQVDFVSRYFAPNFGID